MYQQLGSVNGNSWEYGDIAYRLKQQRGPAFAPLFIPTPRVGCGPEGLARCDPKRSHGQLPASLDPGCARQASRPWGVESNRFAVKTGNLRGVGREVSKQKVAVYPRSLVTRLSLVAIFFEAQSRRDLCPVEAEPQDQEVTRQSLVTRAMGRFIAIIGATPGERECRRGRAPSPAARPASGGS